MCLNHTIATIQKGKNVEEGVKKRRKIDIFHIFHIFISKMWKLEALVYIDNSAFSTFPHFSSQNSTEVGQKYFNSLCVNVESVVYQRF